MGCGRERNVLDGVERRRKRVLAAKTRVIPGRPCGRMGGVKDYGLTGVY
jgi:hypothetical protein